jgi:small subunit ribosomal protein S18
MYRRRRTLPKPRHCAYCERKANPNYKEVEDLAKFVSDRGKIVGRNRSGLCAKHQRKLARAVKRARFLALIPFIQRV